MTTNSRTFKRQLAVGISVATLGVATLFPTAAGASGSSNGGYKPSRGDQIIKQVNSTEQRAETEQRAVALSVPISAGNVAVSKGKGDANAGNQKSTAVASNESTTKQSNSTTQKAGQGR